MGGKFKDRYPVLDLNILENRILTLLKTREGEVGGGYCEEYKFEVKIHDRDVYIEIRRMYSVGNFVTFQFLKCLSELLQTDTINLGEYRHYRGCDTCDYGSSNEITITCENVPQSIINGGVNK